MHSFLLLNFPKFLLRINNSINIKRLKFKLYLNLIKDILRYILTNINQASIEKNNR